MTSSNGNRAHLDRLESRLQRRCPQCGNHPTRVVHLDEETDVVLEANFTEE